MNLRIRYRLYYVFQIFNLVKPFEDSIWHIPLYCITITTLWNYYYFIILLNVLPLILTRYSITVRMARQSLLQTLLRHIRVCSTFTNPSVVYTVMKLSCNLGGGKGAHRLAQLTVCEKPSTLKHTFKMTCVFV